MKTRIHYAFILGVLLSFSCENNETKKENVYSWTKLTVPNASTVYSLYGNIDDELVIGGLSEIIKTKDGGKPGQP